MSRVLSESEWLSNKNNAMKVMVWCIGCTYLASTFVNSINEYILAPVTAESIRRIRMIALDNDKYIKKVPSSILNLMSTLSGDSCWIVSFI